MQRGTLFQLRNLLNRRNISTSVKANVNAWEDFMDVITKGHILTAALEYLGMTSLDSLPDPSLLIQTFGWKTVSIERKKLLDVATQVVNKHVNLATEFDRKDSELKGTVYSYACETLSLSLLLMEFKDGIREGDGNRVMAGKYFFLIFKSSGHKNYAIESFTMLSQYYFVLSPQLAEQLKWSRFINNHGNCGRNISMDLHMEHLNWLCKTAIEGLGANKSKRAILRIGRTVGMLEALLNNFDNDNDVTNISQAHTARNNKKRSELSCQGAARNASIQQNF